MTSQLRETKRQPLPDLVSRVFCKSVLDSHRARSVSAKDEIREKLCDRPGISHSPRIALVETLNWELVRPGACAKLSRSRRLADASRRF